MTLALAAVRAKGRVQQQLYAGFQLQDSVREQVVIGTAHFAGSAQKQWVH